MSGPSAPGARPGRLQIGRRRDRTLEAYFRGAIRPSGHGRASRSDYVLHFRRAPTASRVEGHVSTWVFAAAEHVIQGQLYQRILQRIPDETLQRLAHPVVRRITPDIIREVLAHPCGLHLVEVTEKREQRQEIEGMVAELN